MAMFLIICLIIFNKYHGFLLLSNYDAVTQTGSDSSLDPRPLTQDLTGPLWLRIWFLNQLSRQTCVEFGKNRFWFLRFQVYSRSWVRVPGFLVWRGPAEPDFLSQVGIIPWLWSRSVSFWLSGMPPCSLYWTLLLPLELLSQLKSPSWTSTDRMLCQLCYFSCWHDFAEDNLELHWPPWKTYILPKLVPVRLLPSVCVCPLPPLTIFNIPSSSLKYFYMFPFTPWSPPSLCPPARLFSLTPQHPAATWILILTLHQRFSGDSGPPKTMT